MRIEEGLLIEFDDLANEAAVRSVGSRPDDRVHPANEVGKRVRAHSQAGDDAKAAAAALERPKEIGIRASVGDLDLAVGGHDLRLQKTGRCQAIGFREAAEAAAEDQARDADRHAAAALDITTSLGRHLVVNLLPNRAGPDGNGRLRLAAAFAAGADKGVVRRDSVHVARPNQQGVGRVRGSLVAAAAALHHQPQVVLSGEIDPCDNIARRLGGDRVDARLRRPGADPTQRLSQPDFVTEVIGVFDLLGDLRAGRVGGRADTGGKRRAHLDQAPADIATELHPALVRGPARVAGADAAEPRRRRGVGREPR